MSALYEIREIATAYLERTELTTKELAQDLDAIAQIADGELISMRSQASKPGPKPGSPAAKQSGAQGGKSRPSLKQGPSKQGARHSVPKGKPNK